MSAPASRNPPGPAVPSIDRRTAVVLAILLTLAVAVNLDRFVEGRDALLRAHDVADNTVTGLASCGDFWRSGLQSTWDPTQLRGWPRAGSPQHPQFLMCIAGGIVPPAYIMPIYHVLLLALIATGSYLFVFAYLRRSHESAIAGTLINISLYFFFHEHPIVPSAILLPPLIGFLAIPVRTLAQRVALFAGAALIMGLSNPPPTLILMPLGHLLLIPAAPRGDRMRHLIACVTFWTIYGIYYAPTMAAMLREYADSSRSLYKPPVSEGIFRVVFKERMFNPAILAPGVVLLALVGRRTWRGTLALAAGILGFVVLTAGNEVVVRHAAGRIPLLMSLSTMYYRMYYFVPIAILIWGVWLLEDVRGASPRARLRQAVIALLVTIFSAYLMQDAPRVFMPFWKYTAIIGFVAVAASWWTRRTWAVLLVAAAVFLAARVEFSRVYEVPAQGNLFREMPHYGMAPQPGRTVTVMNDCDAVDLFPAQARAAGEHTLDGISNYYSRRFVERWRYYVNDNPSTCTARYATWSTRTELTRADLAYSADRILAWLWINNVHYVRSSVPLQYPGLTLQDHRMFRVDWTHRVHRYLYRVEEPVGQIFTMPTALAARSSGADLRREEEALSTLHEERTAAPVRVDNVSGSHLRFDGEFGPTVAVIANVNYHRGWTLLVDGERSRQPIEEGPFGMMRLPVQPGWHHYGLVFTSPFTPYVPIFMTAALLLLWIASGRLPGYGFELQPAWRIAPVWIWGLVGVLLCGSAAVLWSRAAPVRPGWLSPAWQHRLTLETDGVPLTGALTGFPVRVEVGPEQDGFWQAMGAEPIVNVVDTSGRRSLPVEIETYDRAQKRLAMWVAVPRLAPGRQTLGYLYFASRSVTPTSERVWDPDFVRVWHAPPEAADVQFLGTSDEWTVEFGVNPARINSNGELIEQRDASGRFNVYLHSGGYLVVERQNGDRTTDAVFDDYPIEPGKWTHVAISRTRNHVRLALDGRALAAHLVIPTFADPQLHGTLHVGDGTYGPLQGQLAEVRISTMARSADWLMAAAATKRPGFVRLHTLESAPR